MLTRVWIVCLTAGVASFALLYAQEPAATQPSAAQALVAQIIALQNATEMRSAVAAYARGNFVSPDNVELNQALLTKALQLGNPEIAYLPAGVLARLNKADGTAFAVLAQMQAKGGEYPEGLRDMVKAVDAQPDNEYVMSRAAELLAWYDRMPSMPGISDDLHKDLERIRGKVENRPTFQQSYEAAKAILAGGAPQPTVTMSVGDPQPTTQSCDQIVAQLSSDARRLRRTVDQLRNSGRGVYATQTYGPTIPNVAQQQNFAPAVAPMAYPPSPGGIYGNSYVPPYFSPNQSGLGVPYTGAYNGPFFGGVVVSPGTGGGRDRD